MLVVAPMKGFTASVTEGWFAQEIVVRTAMVNSGVIFIMRFFTIQKYQTKV